MLTNDYEIQKEYSIGGLTNDVYFFPFNRDIIKYTLDDGEDNALATELNDICYYMFCESATLSVETSIDNNAFKFHKILTLSLYERENETFYNIIENIISNNWLVVVKNKKGEKFIVNAEFKLHSSYNYSFSDSNVGNVCTLQMEVYENIPTIAYNGDLNARHSFRDGSCVGYNYGSVKNLKMAQLNKVRIDYKNDEFEIVASQKPSPSMKRAIFDIEWLKGSFTFTDEYKEDKYTQTLTFSIPFEHYKYYFHYNLLEFMENKYVAFFQTTNGNTVLGGFREGLFPSYSVQTSEQNNTPNTIKITLTASYTTFSTLNQDRETTITNIDKITYKVIETACFGSKVVNVLLQEYRNDEPTNNYYKYYGYYIEGYHIVDEYDLYSTKFGISIISSEYRCSSSYDTLCTYDGIPQSIYLKPNESMSFTYQSDCILSFQAHCANITSIYKTVTVTANDNEGECVMSIIDNEGSIIGSVPIIISNDEETYNYIQIINIDYKKQAVTIRPQVSIDGLQVVSATPNCDYTIKGNTITISANQNDTDDTVTRELILGDSMGNRELIRVIQDYNRSEGVSDELYYRWVDVGETVCLPSLQRVNCMDEEDSETTLCKDGHRYSTKAQFISTLCDENYEFIGYVLDQDLGESEECNN